MILNPGRRQTIRTSIIRSLLLRHQGFDSVEEAFRLRALSLVTTRECWSANQYHPGHFTASGFVLHPENESLLLIFHEKLHRWLQPGGHIEERDEGPLQSAVREIAEECSLDRLEQMATELFDLDIHSIPPRGKQPGHLHFDLRFLFRANSAKARAASDARRVEWVDAKEASKRNPERAMERVSSKLGLVFRSQQKWFQVM